MFGHLIFTAGYLAWIWRFAPPKNPDLKIAGTVVIAVSVVLRLWSVYWKRKVVRLYDKPPQICPKCKGFLEEVRHGLIRRFIRAMGMGVLAMVNLLSRAWAVTDVSAGLRGLTTVLSARPGQVVVVKKNPYDDLVCKKCHYRVVGRPVRWLVVLSISASLLLIAAVLLPASEKYAPEWFPWAAEKARTWWKGIRS